MNSRERELTSVLQEIHGIQVQVTDLTERLARLYDRVQTLAVSSCDEADWELVEEETEVSSSLRVNLPFRRIVEDGPPKPTQEVLGIARSKLSSTAVPVVKRVQRSLDTGHWAWAALSIQALYIPQGPVEGLQSQHWVVLRGPGVTEHFRVTSKTDLNCLVDIKHKDTIVE